MTAPVRLLVLIGLQSFAAMAGILLGVGLMFTWLRFLLRLPLGVCTMYDRGAFAVLTVRPGLWDQSVVTHTAVLFGTSSKSRMR